MVTPGTVVVPGVNVGFGFAMGGLKVPGVEMVPGVTAGGFVIELFGRIGGPVGIGLGLNVEGGAAIVPGLTGPPGLNPFGLGVEKSPPGNAPGRFPSPGGVGFP